MPLTETTVTVTALKGATVGIFASAVIFTDPAYTWMMIVGSIVSLFSVFHTIFSVKDRKFTKMQIVAELIKGFVLGIVSMPLGFLLLSEGILGKAFSIVPSSLSLSISLVGAFIFSWFMTEIINGLLKKMGIWSKKEDRYTEYDDNYSHNRGDRNDNY